MLALDYTTPHCFTGCANIWLKCSSSTVSYYVYDWLYHNWYVICAIAHHCVALKIYLGLCYYLIVTRLQPIILHIVLALDSNTPSYDGLLLTKSQVVLMFDKYPPHLFVGYYFCDWLYHNWYITHCCVALKIHLGLYYHWIVTHKTYLQFTNIGL